MAFMGIFLSWIFIALAIVLIGGLLLCLLIGIILLCTKKKKFSAIPFTIAGIDLVIIIVAASLVLTPLLNWEIEYPDGSKGTVPSDKGMEFFTALEDDDMDTVKKLLDKNPELVFLRSSNYITILDFAMRDGNLELMKTAVDHGAVFDFYDPHLSYRTSFAYLYSNADEIPLPREQKLYDMTEYMIEKGAAMEWERYNRQYSLLTMMIYYITDDDYISRDELKLIKLAIDSGCSTETLTEDTTPGKYLTPLELFKLEIIGCETEDDMRFWDETGAVSWDSVLKYAE